MNVKARLVGRGNGDRRIVDLVRNARKLAQLPPDLCDRAHGHAQRRVERRSAACTWPAATRPLELGLDFTLGVDVNRRHMRGGCLLWANIGSPFTWNGVISARHTVIE